MAYHTIKQFAELCGLDAKNIHTYIGRGKVVKVGKFVDDTDEVNKAFLAARKQLLEVNNSDTPPIERDLKELKEAKPERKEKKTPRIPVSEFDTHDKETIVSLVKTERLKKIEKLDEEITKLKLYNAKQEASVVPIEFVKTIISQLSSSIATHFMLEAENWLTRVSKELDLDRGQFVKYKSEIHKIINKGHDDGVDNSKKALKLLVNDYIDTKEVGQHD